MGDAVTGAKCVSGTVQGQDFLFIVGGMENPPSLERSGLQQFSFKLQTWKEVKPTQAVARNRIMHGATFLNSTSSILVYAGFQDNSYQKSTSTFTISLLPPFNVNAYSAGSQTPAVMNPAVLPWNMSHAVMLGGDAQNQAVWTFGEENGWQPLDVTLPGGLQDMDKVQSAIVNGSDGSKVLELFDMSKSPNSVTTLLLQNATTESPSQPHSQTWGGSVNRRDGVTLAEWPAYNSTLAPQTVRNGFSVAQNPDNNGLVVISGGVDQQNQPPLCLFNQTGNQWIDASEFLTGQPSDSGSSPSASSTAVSPAASLTASSSPTPSQTSAATTSTSSRNNTLKILGASLGGIFGLAALLLIILLLVRYFRQRDSSSQRRRTSDILDDSKQMDFIDRDLDYDQKGGYFGATGHKYSKSDQTQASTTSQTRAVPTSPQAGKKAFFHKPGDSGGSSKSFFNISKPIIAPSPQPINNAFLAPPPAHSRAVPFTGSSTRTDPRNETGWSKYFMNNNSTTNLATLQQNYDRYGRNSKTSRDTFVSGSNSDYTNNSRIASSNLHASAEVAPLDLRASQMRSSSILHKSASPSLSSTYPTLPSSAALARGRVYEEPPSPTTPVSEIAEEDDDPEDMLQSSSGGPESEGHASWSPVITSDRNNNRPPSSVYTKTGSSIYPHPGEKVSIPTFPPVPSNGRNAQPRDEPRGGQVRRGQISVTGEGQRNDPQAYQVNPASANTRLAGASAAYTDISRSFPRREPSPLYDYGANHRDTEDMSWLNLGAHHRS
ncbi:hypothetical protein MMC09_001291 [Bachmanniomyces sp. S44760]|nr:hypothetical protein [Bachmanniomyces sp. S44760]